MPIPQYVLVVTLILGALVVVVYVAYWLLRKKSSDTQSVLQDVSKMADSKTTERVNEVVEEDTRVFEVTFDPGFAYKGADVIIVRVTNLGNWGFSRGTFEFNLCLENSNAVMTNAASYEIVDTLQSDGKHVKSACFAHVFAVTTV